MLGFNPFTRPTSSYERPVPLVLVDPDVDVDYTVCFNSAWLPVILGALSQMIHPHVWDTDDRTTLMEQLDRARLLVAMFIDQCPTELPSEGCTEFLPSASFISYYPMNPYSDPTAIPPGWSAIPFVIADSTLAAILAGVEVGDVVALPGSFPNPDDIATVGLSAIHLDVVGTGVVELHLVSIPAGSVVAVTVDDDGLHTQIVDTNADIIAIPPESAGVFVHEVEITEPGEHHIDIRITPIVDDSAIPLRYGAGLRKVVLCGFDALAGDTMFDIRQNEESPCSLEKSTDGGETWTTFADLTLCPPNIRVNNGRLQHLVDGTWTDMETSGDERYDGTAEHPYTDPPEGESGSCLAAENIAAALASSLTQLKTGLEGGLTVAGIGSAIAAYIAYIGAFPIALIVGAVSALVASGVIAGAEGIDDILTGDDIDTFKCIIDCDAASDGFINLTAFNAIKGHVDIQIGGGTAALIKYWMDTLGPVGMTRAATSGGITTGDCGDCACADDVTITVNSGSSDEAGVRLFQTFTVTSAAAPGAGCPDDHYLDFALSPTAKLEVVTLTGWTVPCQNASSAFAIWSTYPTGLWLNQATLPSGELDENGNRFAFWGGGSFSVTFRLISV